MMSIQPQPNSGRQDTGKQRSCCSLPLLASHALLGGSLSHTDICAPVLLVHSLAGAVAAMNARTSANETDRVQC